MTTPKRLLPFVAAISASLLSGCHSDPDYNGMTVAIGGGNGGFDVTCGLDPSGVTTSVAAASFFGVHGDSDNYYISYTQTPGKPTISGIAHILHRDHDLYENAFNDFTMSSNGKVTLSASRNYTTVHNHTKQAQTTSFLYEDRDAGGKEILSTIQEARGICGAYEQRYKKAVDDNVSAHTAIEDLAYERMDKFTSRPLTHSDGVIRLEETVLKGQAVRPASNGAMRGRASGNPSTDPQ